MKRQKTRFQIDMLFKLSEHNSFFKKTEQKNKEHDNGVIERIIKSHDITNSSMNNHYAMYSLYIIHSFCHSIKFSKLILSHLIQIESNIGVHYFKVHPSIKSQSSGIINCYQVNKKYQTYVIDKLRSQNPSLQPIQNKKKVKEWEGGGKSVRSKSPR